MRLIRSVHDGSEKTKLNVLCLSCFLLALSVVFSACDSKPADRAIPSPVESSSPILSEAEMQQLRALGYVGGTHEEPPPRQHEAMYTPNQGTDATAYTFALSGKPVENLLSGISGPEDMEIAARTRKSTKITRERAVLWKGAIAENCVLHFGAGQTYAQIIPNSLVLQLDILDADSHPLQQEIVSSVAGAWIDRNIDLHEYSGQTIQLVFSVLSLDRSQDQNPIYLSPLMITSPQSDRQAAPHVFFIIVDTLRADALGCYGQSEPVTPHLDRLAQEGALAERMTAQSPHTETSMPSILLGQYPHVHGRMLRFSKHNTAQPIYIGKNTLSRSSPSIAERFQQAGYWTAGYYNNLLISRKYDFHRGFHEYTDYAAESGMTDPWGRIALPTAHIGVEEVIRWIDKVPKHVPLFVFLHILDPHNPYTPPGNFNLSVHKPANQIDQAAYLGETAYVDDQIGLFVNYLKLSNLYRESIILVTSDHGEEFYNELGRPIGHGRTLFQTQLHIPFICVYPGKISPGIRIADWLESVDIYPTLLELAQLEATPNTNGESFASLMLSNSPKGKRRKTDAVAEGIRRGEERKCLIQDPYKLIYFRDSDRSFLYDLRQDPNELNDIALENPETVHQLKKRLFERLGMKEPVIQPLDVVNLGQDGWDLVHTFDKDSSYWRPGISDLHLRVQPVPDQIEHVEIWADDHLHGNRNYAFGWRRPAYGENPVAIENQGEAADLFFEQQESLNGTRFFVRLIDAQDRMYLGSFDGQEILTTPNRAVQSKYPALVKLDFEDPDSIQQWRTGEGGSLTIQPMGSNSVLLYEAITHSGSFRAYRIIPKIPAGRRVCIAFELAIESGGIKIELIHPKSARAIAAHTFSTETESDHITRVETKTPSLYGITGISQFNEELLFLLSNYSPQNTPAQVLFDDITVYLYPEELESASGETIVEGLNHPDF